MIPFVISSRLSPDVNKDNGAVIDSEEGEGVLPSSEKPQNRKRKHHSSDKHKHRKKSKKKHKHRSERKKKKKRRSTSESDSSSSESGNQEHWLSSIDDLTRENLTGYLSDEEIRDEKSAFSVSILWVLKWNVKTNCMCLKLLLGSFHLNGQTLSVCSQTKTKHLVHLHKQY